MARSFRVEEESSPDIPQLMMSVVEVLGHFGGSATIQEIDEKIIEIESVSEEEQAILMPNGRDRRLNYYLAWARTYLKRGGILENSSRGVWAVSEGASRPIDITVARSIYKTVNEEERARRRDKKSGKNGNYDQKRDKIKEELEVEKGSVSPEKADWKDEILQSLLEISPSAFERLSQRLLREAGFIKVEVRGKTGDGGIDGVGVLMV